MAERAGTGDGNRNVGRPASDYSGTARGREFTFFNSFPKIWENGSKLDPADDAEEEDEIIPIDLQSTDLRKAVPSWESVEMVPKGGLEPPHG